MSIVSKQRKPCLYYPWVISRAHMAYLATPMQVLPKCCLYFWRRQRKQKPRATCPMDYSLLHLWVSQDLEGNGARTELIISSHKASLRWWHHLVSQTWTPGVILNSSPPWYQAHLILPPKEFSNPSCPHHLRGHHFTSSPPHYPWPLKQTQNSPSTGRLPPLQPILEIAAGKPVYPAFSGSPTS